jgi:hypothetical protein
MASDDGLAQIAFHESMTKPLFPLSEFSRALRDAETMMAEALNSN